MNLAKWTPASFGLAILLALAFYAAPAEAQARAPATPAAPAPAAATTPAPAAPAAAATATPAPPNAAAAPNAAVPSGSRPEQGSSGVPGAPSDATTETIVVPSRTTAMLAGKAKWDDGFASIKDALAKIKGALDKAGLKPAGSPFTVFTQTDDNGFSYEAMVPLAAKPAGELSDGVQLGSSPSGKAIKFHHRGPYDDIDSTYDRITTYLDEKDLEARDFFIEEYLTDLTSSEDPNLAVDIYVFIK